MPVTSYLPYLRYNIEHPAIELLVALLLPLNHTVMPILHDFTVPKAVAELVFPSATDTFFIAFLASKDPQTNKPWCPDVVAAIPTLEATFTGAKKPNAAFVDVGQRPEYDNRDYMPIEKIAKHCTDGETLRMCFGLSGRSIMCQLWYALRRQVRESRNSDA